MSLDAQTNAFSAFAEHTNKRQAAKVIDLGSKSVLYCAFKPGSDIYFGWCESAIHGVWLVNGAYTDDRHVDTPTLAEIVARADIVDVEQEPKSSVLRILRNCGGGE